MKKKINFNNGDIFDGELINSNMLNNTSSTIFNSSNMQISFEISGKGKYIFSNGSYLEGNFENGQMTGQGVCYDNINKFKIEG